MPVRTHIDINGPGLFFITTTIVDWLSIFLRHDVAVTVLDQFAETSRMRNVSIVGYVLMPSHLHALVGVNPVNLLTAYVQAFKSLSSRRIKEIDIKEYREFLHRSGRYRLWQRGFDDFMISSEKQFKIKLEYIHNNPVKAGLVSDAVDYPYSSALDWLGAGQGLIEIDKEFSWMGK
jgi:putative transposase